VTGLRLYGKSQCESTGLVDITMVKIGQPAPSCNFNIKLASYRSLEAARCQWCLHQQEKQPTAIYTGDNRSENRKSGGYGSRKPAGEHLQATPKVETSQ
jgi:hypothetical protein